MDHSGEADRSDEAPTGAYALLADPPTEHEVSDDNIDPFGHDRSVTITREERQDDVEAEFDMSAEGSADEDGNESDSPPSRTFVYGSCVVRNGSSLHAPNRNNRNFYEKLSPPLQSPDPEHDGPPDQSSSELSSANELPETPHTHALAVVHSTRKTGLLLTTWNLFNDVLSCGVVAYPFYISEAGVGAGPLMLLIYAIMCDSTLLLLYDIATKHHLTSFAHMAHVAAGRKGYILSSIMMFIFNWGGYVGNIIVMANILPDLMTGIFGHHDIFERRYLLVFAVVAFSPIAYYKGLARFAVASALSVWALIFLSFLIIFRYFIDRDHFALPASPDSTRFYQPNILPALGGFSFMYTCQDMFFHVFHSLHQPTRKRVAFVAHSIMFGMCGLAMAVGLCGYLIFYDGIQQNILDNFGTHDIPTQIARALLVFNVIISVPYTNYIPRVAIQAVIQLYRPELVVKQTNPSNKRIRTIIHATITTCLLGSGLLVAEFVTDLGVVFELVGGLSAVCISLVIPAFCYLKLEPDGPRFTRIWCYVVLVSGLFGMVGVVGSVIAGLT